MTDFKMDSSGDLEINALGDISTTESVSQAVLIRLRWFLREWRLGPSLGFPYFEEVFVKNPNLTKIRFLLREEIMGVEGVTNVTGIEIAPDPSSRRVKIAVAFTVGEEKYREEVVLHA